MAKFKKIYKSVFEEITSEISRSQNITKTKAALNVIANCVCRT